MIKISSPVLFYINYKISVTDNYVSDVFELGATFIDKNVKK